MMNRSSISWVESAAVGSSMISTRDSWERARAISTTCLWATERVRSGASTSRSDSSPRRISLARRRMPDQSTRPNRFLARWPVKMFSATDSSSNITVSWWTAVMPRRQASWVL